MKAIKVTEPYKVEIVEIEKPEIKNPGEVLVKIKAGGICGSDLGIYKGINSLATLPRIIGHEFAGVVEEIGEGVEGIAVGDKVAVDPVVSCGECYACTHGRHNVCSTLEVIGVHRDGGFCEYIVVNYKNLHKTSKDTPFETLCLVEPFTIGAQINSRGQIGGDDTLLIMGCGPIGLTVLQIAKKNGVRVIMTDLLESRLKMAKEMGADRVVNVKEEDLYTAVNEFTNNVGINVVVDAVCNTKSFEQAVEVTSPAGRIVVIGLLAQPSQIAQAGITKKELTITGSRLSNYKFHDVIEWMDAGQIKPEMIRTHMYHYTEIAKAIDVAVNNPQDVCKIVIKFD
jgi:L-gulonate 5-dehydrogenase